MANKPKYIDELEEKVERMNLKLAETGANQDHMQEQQAEMLRRLNEIHICLAGTEYDKGCNGGLVNQVNNNSRSVKAIEKKQTKILSFWAGATAVVTAIGTTLLNFLLFKSKT